MDAPTATQVHSLQSPVAIYSYDILRHIFDLFEASISVPLGRDPINRRTLAACTRVCHVWHEPAAQVLWRTLSNFHPLWNLLSGRNFPPEAKWLSAFWQFVDAQEFVKDIVEREPERWQHFLHRASHVRNITVAVACSQSELRMISALTEHNQGKSILPALHKLSWRHAVPMDTSLLLLGSPSLSDLEISISRLGTESTGGNAFAPPQRYDDHHIVDPVFVGLADAVPQLRRLSIAGREGPGPDLLITPLLGLTALRELYLHNQSCSLGPEQVHSIFESLCNLESLFARIVHFSSPGPPVCAASLRSLRVYGTLDDVMGFLTPGFLELPLLQSLSLRAFADDASTLAHDSHLSRLFSMIASAPFAKSLRSLTVHLLNDTAEFQWVNSSDEARTYAAIIRPIFALKDLEHVDVCLGVKINPIPDADVLEVARAWKHIRTLYLTYPPFLSYPSLTSIRYFAEHCPELRELTMSKLSIPEKIDVPPAGRRSTPHPLHTLDLKMTFGQNEEQSDKLDKVAIARFVDHLFPNLVLKTLSPDKLPPARTPENPTGIRIRKSLFSWNTIEQEIWGLRRQALEGVDTVPLKS
ncbi:hypothetical protein C8Q80DRAFT_182730 [Daedaleopsis nitida]|nr:hypothetical protein C8Q80DRAFT_182730 [Daedaleopsis nitida]